MSSATHSFLERAKVSKGSQVAREWYHSQEKYQLKARCRRFGQTVGLNRKPSWARQPVTPPKASESMALETLRRSLKAASSPKAGGHLLQRDIFTESSGIFSKGSVSPRRWIEYLFRLRNHHQRHLRRRHCLRRRRVLTNANKLCGPVQALSSPLERASTRKR